MSAFKRRLKVLYLGTLPPHQGGSAFSNAQILFGLAARGHRIQAIAPMAADVSNDYDAFADSHPEIDVTRFMMPHFETDPFNPASSDYRVRQTTQSLHLLGEMLTAEPRDVVFVGRESFIWGVPDLARQHRVPCVINLRGVINAIANGTYPHELGQALLAELRRTDCATVPARYMHEMLRSLGIAHGKMILNAVDTTSFSCGAKAPGLMQKLGLNVDQTIVLHVSNLKSVKRVDDLVESAHRDVRENERLVYVIVGDGPRRVRLESTCSALGLTDKVKFVGWVPHDNMPEYIRLADIVIMPSEAEGLARVYLETQACGRLLLASDIPAAHEISNQGATAMLFRTGDIDDLTTKTLLAASNPDLRVAIGHWARQNVVRHHRLEEAVASYEATLQNLVHSKAS